MELKATTFTDEQGREWNARITYKSMRELKAAGLPLENVEQHLQALLFGGVELFDWLWAVMRDQAKPQRLEKEAFCDAMFEVRGAALTAFVSAIENFFQKLNPTRAAVFAAALDEVEKEAAAMFSEDASSSAENVESTPASTRLGN